ncbi:THUMP domain-containing protein [Chromobacterium phragmitis]|uniref:RNA methyltransferase n=1 Tax=Chromobacterium phragmitis TaxID=2202141 RepID=A0A344UGN8_9NEIS|nr:THUMP domain-containing protein [Chromobacterium phragmitis]AXE34436.1 RNA methyltransferase [Chromobacterium phragmitis]
MSSFRSRQRASQRRDQTSRERAANSPAGGNPNAPDRQPQDGKPRAPYSGQRPGPGKPDWKAGQEPRQFDKRPQGEGQQKRFHRDGDKPAWQPRQDDRRFDDRGEGQQKRFHRDGDKPAWQPRQDDRRFDKRDDRGEGQQKRFHRDGDKPAWQPRQDDRRFDKRDDRGEGQQKRFHRDGDKPAWQPRQDDRRYDRDRGPSNRKPLPEGVERASEFRRDDKPQDKRYSRDRGPSGRKPLHTDDAPPRPFKPRAEGDDRRDDKPQWQPREDRAPRQDGDAPRKLFAKREDGERDNRFRRDDKPQWQPREDRAPRQDGDAPRKLFAKREDSERDNRFRRDDKPQWQPREDRAPRQDGDAPRKPFAKREDGERDNRFRRDDKPQWQPREDRAPRHDGDAPRKLFAKREDGERDNRFRRDDKPQWQPREDRAPRHDRGEHRPRGLQPFSDAHRVDQPRRAFEQRPHDGGHGRAPAPRAENVITNRLDSRLALFAPCPRGLEQILADELLALGAGDIAPADGGVAFAGDARLMMAVNLHSRTASRVLLRLAHGGYHAEQDIYRLAMSVDWPRWFDVSRTIKLKADGIAARVKSLDYIALTVKDAICDRFRQAHQGRPSVDTRRPDVRVNVFLTADEATIYLDTSGEPLFKRGWREETGEAPLRENLAAGILLLAGYDGSQPLLDPMCGSGTFLVEAADIALNRAPGRSRGFGFEALAGFDSASWEKLQLDARKAEQTTASLAIRGSDRSQAMINIARANLERAGLADLIELSAADVADTRPHAEHGLIVSNPPYGVRLEEQEQLAEWYPELGDWLKAHFAGWTACLFSGDLRLGKLIRLAPKRRTPLFNGSLQCRLFVINMVEGSARKQKDGDEGEIEAEDGEQ